MQKELNSNDLDVLDSFNAAWEIVKEEHTDLFSRIAMMAINKLTDDDISVNDTKVSIQQVVNFHERIRDIIPSSEIVNLTIVKTILGEMNGWLEFDELNEELFTALGKAYSTVNFN
ncbi:hypothetical protein [Pseudomonas aeruginosa]|uniref:hypothetical protein n=1 Tax=Pseudomonas aeruginosa TaxID=287 RepID=UPI001CA4F274|nr:hypothetical protein [Pseudomonas aeruginosa]MBW6070693.1 hypothetical protein [Pseudomonas aeruginosa]